MVQEYSREAGEKDTIERQGCFKDKIGVVSEPA